MCLFHCYFMTLQRRHLSVHREEGDIIPAEKCLLSNLRLDSEGCQDKILNRCRLSSSFISKTDCMLVKASFLYGELENVVVGLLCFAFRCLWGCEADPLLQVLRTI